MPTAPFPYAPAHARQVRKAKLDLAVRRKPAALIASVVDPTRKPVSFIHILRTEWAASGGSAQEPVAQWRCSGLEIKISTRHSGSCRITSTPLSNTMGPFKRMGSNLSSARFGWKGLGRLRPRTLTKSCGARMASDAFVRPVGFSPLFEYELLGIVMPAKPTAEVFPASRGVRLSPA